MGKEHSYLYRAVKFKIFPDAGQRKTLQSISDNLWSVWNDALAERVTLFEMHHKPLYEAIKTAREENDEIRLYELRLKLKQAFRDHRITHFDQCKSLTPRRKTSASFAAVPCAWQQETLKILDGAFRSYLSLKKKGDLFARPPREQRAEEFFEIQGLLSFALGVGDHKVAAQKKIASSMIRLLHEGRQAEIVLSPGKSLPGGAELRFKLASYAGKKLGEAVRVKKFTLYRDPPDMRQSGNFWISLAYEVEKTEAIPFDPNRAVYIALGASSLGVVSPSGEEVLKLWRPDKHWEPKRDTLKKRIAMCTKGSRAWKRRQNAKLCIEQKSARQRKDSDRKIVIEKLVAHGVHFVISDIVIRGKKGRLADASKEERGGVLGLNWSAQNTGIARLVQHLEQKAEEHGGSVRKFRATSKLPTDIGQGHENKIAMARRLKDDFLASQ